MAVGDIISRRIIIIPDAGAPVLGHGSTVGVDGDLVMYRDLPFGRVLFTDLCGQ